MGIDLHFHSDASDGTRSHSVLSQLLVNLKIKVASLTDHDNMDNVSNLIEDLKDYDIKIIPGIELSTIHNGHNIHLLGYFKDDSWKKEEFKTILSSFRQRRINRAEEMILRLKEHFGIVIDIKDVDLRPGASLGRPHLAKLIGDKYHMSLNDVFKKFLNNDSPAYIPSSSMSYIEGIKLLLSFNGVPVIAHPIEYKEDIRNLLLPGLKGIECYYPTHDKSYANELVRVAKENDLFITCGTDDHGIPSDKKHGIIGSQKYDIENIRPFLNYMGV